MHWFYEKAPEKFVCLETGAQLLFDLRDKGSYLVLLRRDKEENILEGKVLATRIPIEKKEEVIDMLKQKLKAIELPNF